MYACQRMDKQPEWASDDQQDIQREDVLLLTCLERLLEQAGIEDAKIRFESLRILHGNGQPRCDERRKGVEEDGPDSHLSLRFAVWICAATKYCETTRYGF